MKKAEAQDESSQLCQNCGSAMVTEDGQTYCPKCASKINWGLEDEDQDEAL